MGLKTHNMWWHFDLVIVLLKWSSNVIYTSHLKKQDNLCCRTSYESQILNLIHHPTFSINYFTFNFQWTTETIFKHVLSLDFARCCSLVVFTAKQLVCGFFSSNVILLMFFITFTSHRNLIYVYLENFACEYPLSSIRIRAFAFGALFLALGTLLLIHQVSIHLMRKNDQQKHCHSYGCKSRVRFWYVLTIHNSMLARDTFFNEILWSNPTILNVWI